MSTTVCLLANTLYYPEGGGHMWAYLNWALGLRTLDCRVVWLEKVIPGRPENEARIAALQDRLKQYNLAEYMGLYSFTGEPLSLSVSKECLDLEAAAEADLLLNLSYEVPPEVVRCFQRSALLDIDPGLLQIWMSRGWMKIAPHDVYFTIGERIAQPEPQPPNLGLKWQYTPPCVALDWWPPHDAIRDAPFTTVSHWSTHEWMEDSGELYSNDKRSGFLPFLDLPQYTSQPLELALCLAVDEEDERMALQQRGWRLRDAYAVASTPWDYQRYVQDSLGEFSCAKPSYTRLQNSWISDRTLCYLASGKPTIVQYTGVSQFLPDSAGLFRFHDIDEAAAYLKTVADDYERQSKLARALAEEYFDAQKVIVKVLERVLA